MIKEKIRYGIEVHVKGDIWCLRDDIYEEDELELARKNLAYSKKVLPNDKFRIVKLESRRKTI